MGKRLPETCWAESKINKIVIVASSWSFILFTYIDDIRSNTNQIDYVVLNEIIQYYYSNTESQLRNCTNVFTQNNFDVWRKWIIALSVAVTVYYKTMFCFPCATCFSLSGPSVGFVLKYIKVGHRISPRITYVITYGYLPVYVFIQSLIMVH